MTTFCLCVFLSVCGEEDRLEVVHTQGEHGERRRRAELELVEVNIATAAAAALASAATKAKVSNNLFDHKHLQSEQKSNMEMF